MANSSSEMLCEQTWDCIESWDQIRYFVVELVRFVCMEIKIAWFNIPGNFYYLTAKSPLRNNIKDVIRLYLENYEKDFLTIFGFLVPQGEAATLEIYSKYCKHLMSAAVIADIEKDFPPPLTDIHSLYDIEKVKIEASIIKLFVHVLHLAQSSALFHQQGAVNAPKFAMLVIDDCLRLFLRKHETHYCDHTQSGDNLVNFFNLFASFTILETAQATKRYMQTVNIHVSGDNINVHKSNMNVKNEHDADANTDGYANMDVFYASMMVLQHFNLMNDQCANVMNQGSFNVIRIDHQFATVVDQAFAKVMYEAQAEGMDKASAKAMHETSPNQVDKGLANVMNQSPTRLMKKRPAKEKNKQSSNMSVNPSNIMHSYLPNMEYAWWPNTVPPEMMNVYGPNIMYAYYPNMMNTNLPKS